MDLLGAHAERELEERLAKVPERPDGLYFVTTY